MPTLNYPGTPGTTLYGGIDPAVLLTTITLLNPTTTEQAAGFVSEFFGLPLKQGDVPAGEYPVLTLENGTVCPLTPWGVTTWPDGSMKFCAGMIRVPTAVPASSIDYTGTSYGPDSPGIGKLTIEVKSGGDAPAASARSTSDLTAADFSVVLTGVTNLSGDWTASLNTAITDDDETVVIGDGPAGKVWRIRGSFKQSGSPHGQLECYHYVAALQDGSAGLLGLRYLGRACQPWHDVASPTRIHRVVNAVFKSGATTLRTIEGHETDETPGANILLPHYGSIPTCGTDAKWDFVQGGGSASADCTIRVVQDMEYVASTRNIVPYDRTLTASDSAAVSHYAHGRGNMTRSVTTTGERDEIGIAPRWVAAYALNGSSASENAVRVNAMVTMGWRTGLRNSTTGEIVPTTSVSVSYDGLGTIQSTWRLGNGVTGFPDITTNTSLWSSEVTGGSHRGAPVYYAYLFTGEPQYLDLLQEQASTQISALPQGSGSVWTVTDPVTSAWSGEFHSRDPVIGGTTYKGAGLLFRDDLARFAAWMMRDVAHAASICPDVCPKGTEVKTYFRDVIDNNHAAFVAYRNALSADYRDNGILGLKPFYKTDESVWAMGFLANSLAHQSQILGSANALTCAQHFANFFSKIEEQIDFAAAACDRTSVFDASGNRVNTVAELFFLVSDVSIDYATSGNLLTFTGGNNSFGFANGDKLMGDPTYMSSVTLGQTLYVINKSGRSFQVSTTPGGSPITVTGDGLRFGPYMRITDFSPTLSYEDSSNQSSYISIIKGAINHLKAVGCTGLDGPVAEVATRTAGINYALNPKNAVATAYPA